MCCRPVFIILPQLWAETRKVYSNPVTTVICALLQGILIDCFGLEEKTEKEKTNKQRKKPKKPKQT